MRTRISESADFAYELQLKALPSLDSSYSLEVLSTWKGAKKPDESRRVLQLTVNRDGIKALTAALLGMEERT